MEKKNRDDSSKKRRFIGMEFTLDGVPKEESESLQIQMRNNGNGLEARIVTKNRVIKTNAITGYQRKNKAGFKKITHLTDSSIFDVRQNLEKYQGLIAIDTNGRRINKRMIHLGIACEVSRIINGDFLDTKIEVLKEFLIYGECEKPENENWKRLLDHIIGDSNYNPKSYIGIIVDSDLGNLPEHNRRERPIINDYFLPKNFELIYASADIKNDTILNKAISYCDEVSSTCLKEIEKGMLQLFKIISFGNCFRRPPFVTFWKIL